MKVNGSIYRLFFSVLSFIMVLFLDAVHAEDMTITTYYPSPNGTYDALSVKRLSVGDTNADGYINASDVPATSGYLLVADRLGIGTAAPTESLVVNGLIKIPNATSTDNNSPGIVAVSDDDFLYDGQYINHYGIGFHSYDDGSGYAGTNVYISGYYGIDLFTGGAERLRVNNNGRVGIGTTSPAYTLDVNGTIRAGSSALLSTGGGAGYYQDATNGAYRSIVSSSTTNGYYFQTNAGATTSMYIGLGGTYNGNVGIGTTTPSYPFVIGSSGVALTSAATGRVVYVKEWVNGNGQTGGAIAISDDGSFVDWNDGYITYEPLCCSAGFKTNSPLLVAGGELTVSNGIFRSGTRSNFFLALQGDRNMVLYDNGGAVWASGTSTSDKKLKKNIVVLDNVLKKLNGINGVRFNWINEAWGTRPEIGLIAQEVEKEFPELVWTDPQSDNKLVKYEKLTPVLIQAIKEQQQQIDSLKKEIAELRRRH